jgi:hypothetical protein
MSSWAKGAGRKRKSGGGLPSRDRRVLMNSFLSARGKKNGRATLDDVRSAVAKVFGIKEPAKCDDNGQRDRGWIIWETLRESFEQK